MTLKSGSAGIGVEVLVVGGQARARWRPARSRGTGRRGSSAEARQRAGARATPGEPEPATRPAALTAALSVTTSSPFIRLWPEPQYSEHSIGKVPARLATKETPTVSPPFGIATFTA